MTIGVGIIGAGIGAQHLAGYRQWPDRYTVRWMCDLDRRRAETAVAGLDRTDRAHEANGQDIRLTEDIADLLADPACAIVDICVPPHLHLPLTLRALEAGKTVICEKPLVTSLAEMDALEAAVERSAGRVFPVFQYRYGLGMAQLRAVLAAGLAGPPQVATLETHWDRGADYYATGWRGTWAGERGGAIVTHAIHIHDLLREAFGPIDTVQAQLATRINPIDTDDCAALVMRMACGALVTSSVTLGAAGNHSRLRLVYRDVTVDSDLAPYAPAAAGWRFTARNPQHQAHIDAALAQVVPVPLGFAGYLGAVADTLEGTLDGAQISPIPAVTLADARAALSLITATYASARFGTIEPVALTRDHPLYASWQPDTAPKELLS
ncbi:MAG: Gfo/Idh/MocA family oxidoreductase [Paracoccaceae bacterium]